MVLLLLIFKIQAISASQKVTFISSFPLKTELQKVKNKLKLVKDSQHSPSIKFQLIFT